MLILLYISLLSCKVHVSDEQASMSPTMIEPCKGNLSSPLIKPCPKGPKKGKGSPSGCSRSTAETAESTEDSPGKTTDHVKNKKRQPLLPSWFRNVHRGYNSKEKNEEGFLGFLSEALCGACVFPGDGEEKAIAQVERKNNIGATSGPKDRPLMPTDIYVQRFEEKLKLQELEVEKHGQEASWDRNISYLTDPSLMEIEHVLEQPKPTKSSDSPKLPPAFRKLQEGDSFKVKSRKK